MAEYRYGYRSYNPQYEVEPWHDEWNHSSDNLIHPMISDPDGRPYPTSRSPPTNSYIVQTETYIIRPSNYSGYNYPPKGSYTMDHEVDDRSQWRRSPPMASQYANDDRPPEVEDFLTKVQTDASRPSGYGSPPQATRRWGRSTYPPEFTEPYSRFHDEHRPVRSNILPPAPNWTSYGTNPDPSQYRSYWPGRPERSTTEPPPASGSGGWPSHARENPQSRPGQGTKLSAPISDIGEAVEYLKETLKPFSSHTAPPNSRQTSVPILWGTEPSVPKDEDRRPTEAPRLQELSRQNSFKPSQDMNTNDVVHTSANTGRKSATEAAHAGSAGSNNPNKTDAAYASVISSKPNGADTTYANAAASRPYATDAAYGGSAPRKPETKAAANAGREYTIRPEPDTMDGAYEGTVSGKPSTTAAYAGNVPSKPKSTDGAYSGSVSNGSNTTNSPYKSTMTSREAAKKFNGLLM